MIELWFESHATTRDNERQVASGWQNVELSEAGTRQAKEMVARNRDRGIAAVFCSDLQRAVLSGVPTVNELHLPLYPDERLRECNYGDLDGKPKSVMEAERISHIEVPFPNGESYVQCAERVQSFLDDLKRDFDGRTVLVIGHRATQYGLEHICLGKPLKQCIEDKWQWQPGWRYEIV